MSITCYLFCCPPEFRAGLIDRVAGGGGLLALPVLLSGGIPPCSALDISCVQTLHNQLLSKLMLTKI